MAKRQLEPIPGPEARELETHEEFREARTLLPRHLIVNTPDGSKNLEIFEVEPFAEILTPDDKRIFDAKPRTRGEVIVLWRRGNPKFNIVVDPNEGTIVCIRTCKLDDKEVNASQLLALLGLTKANQGGYTGLRTTVAQRVDGQQTYTNDPQAELRIAQLAETAGTVLNIRKNISSIRI